MHPIEIPLEDISQEDYGKTNYDKYLSLQHNLHFYRLDINGSIPYYLDTIISYSRGVSWLFLTTEENKQGVLHFHGIFAVKNLIDYNKPIAINLTQELKKKYKNIDILIKPLNHFIDIKKWIKYMHVNKIWIFKPYFYTIVSKYKYMENLFKKAYLKNYNLHNTVYTGLKNKYHLDDQNNIKNNNLHSIEFDWLRWEVFQCPFQWENNNYINVSGCILSKNQIYPELILDLVVYYLIFKNYYIAGDFIYQKKEKFFISYNLIGSIKEILFDNFELNIISFFVSNYPCHFIGFDSWFLLKLYKNNMENVILKIKNLSTNKITLDYTLMEFTDGIYNIRLNKFYSPDKIKNNSLWVDKATVKCYNKSYSNVRKNIPTTWIKGLQYALNYNKINFIVICLFLAELFQHTKEENKKHFLYVYGPSNTGKTTYLGKVLSRFFGHENVGSILNNTTDFKFQDIQNKLLIIIDEFKYRSSESSELLKLLSGEPLLTNKKYAKNHITISNLMGLILSNSRICEKNENIQQALLNRLHIVEFKNSFISKTFNIHKNLHDEEAEIIISCNKLYFAYFNKKTPRIKNSFTKTKNKTVLELTHKPSKTFSFFTFCFQNVAKYTVDFNYLREINKDIYVQNELKKKFDHYNFKFEVRDNFSNFHANCYASASRDGSKYCEKLIDTYEQPQYIWYNKQCFIYNNVEQKIITSINKHPRDIEIAQTITQSLIKSKKLEKIENILSKNYIENQLMFDQCIKKIQNIQHCYEIYMIKYNTQTELLSCAMYDIVTFF